MIKKTLLVASIIAFSACATMAADISAVTTTTTTQPAVS